MIFRFHHGGGRLLASLLICGMVNMLNPGWGSPSMFVEAYRYG